MANFEHPDGEAGNPPVQDGAAGLSAKGAARRRFARAGAGASAGVIATLASPSAMAAMKCMTPSAYCSGNTSRANTVTCSGVSPGYWKNHHSEWDGAGVNGDAKFSLLFPLTGSCSQLAPYSCFDIVDPDKVANGDDKGNVAMHMMATLLNVRSARITFMTERQVKDIWEKYSFDGSYSPVPGTVWSGAQIVAYLTSTMS